MQQKAWGGSSGDLPRSAYLLQAKFAHCMSAYRLSINKMRHIRASGQHYALSECDRSTITAAKGYGDRGSPEFAYCKVMFGNETNEISRFNAVGNLRKYVESSSAYIQQIVRDISAWVSFTEIFSC